MSITAKLSNRQTFQASLHTAYIVSTASPIKVTEVYLLSSNWVGTESPYSQVVSVDGVTEHSKVDLQPSVEQLEMFHGMDIAFSTENENGVVTVYVIGDKPTQDYTIQATITEVNV